MDQWSANLFDGRWAGDTEQEAPGNWAPVTAAQPAHHQEGNQHVWTDGSSIHVWREPGQGYDQGSGSSSWRDQPGQGSWDQPGQGSWDQPQQKREQKRRLEREGKPVPSELLPQKQSLNKATRARQSEEATSAEDLDDIAQELQKLQAQEASRLQDTVPARRQHVGKHRSQSVQPEKGESKGAAKGDSCASAGPPQDGKAEPEKGRKPSKSRARRAKKKQKDDKDAKEEPEEGDQHGDGQPKPEEGKKDPPGDGSATGPSTAAA